MKYNISISVPGAVCANMIELSKKIFDQGGLFALGAKENIPHMTVAHFECCDPYRFHDTVRDCERSFAPLKSFVVYSDKYRKTNGWIDISYVITNDLKKIYDTSVRIIEKNSCEKTSDDWDVNVPHITLSRMKDGATYDIGTLPKRDYSFRAHEIAICALGEYGTNKRVLKKMILG